MDFTECKVGCLGRGMKHGHFANEGEEHTNCSYIHMGSL